MKTSKITFSIILILIMGLVHIWCKIKLSVRPPYLVGIIFFTLSISTPIASVLFVFIFQNFKIQVKSVDKKTKQKYIYLSKLGSVCLYYTVKKNFRIVLLHTIQEPLERNFQNTPYFGQRDNFSTLGG